MKGISSSVAVAIIIAAITVSMATTSYMMSEGYLKIGTTTTTLPAQTVDIYETTTTIPGDTTSSSTTIVTTTISWTTVPSWTTLTTTPSENATTTTITTDTGEAIENCCDDIDNDGDGYENGYDSDCQDDMPLEPGLNEICWRTEWAPYENDRDYYSGWLMCPEGYIANRTNMRWDLAEYDCLYVYGKDSDEPRVLICGSEEPGKPPEEGTQWVKFRFVSDSVQFQFTSDSEGVGIGVEIAWLECVCPNEGSTRYCYTGPSGTDGVGECYGGSETCTNGIFGDCEGEVTPVEEICGDGKDNDCDGYTDEYCQEICTHDDNCTVSECMLGTCNSTGMCEYTPVDDNTTCLEGICCSGSCGSPTCSANTECGEDACTIYTCVEPETCAATCISEEITECINDDGCCPSDCDSTSDNDCTGCTPEETRDCPLQQGVCLGSQETCNAQGQWSGCTADNYGSDYEETEVSCDGKDNDCDGNTDCLDSDCYGLIGPNGDECCNNPSTDCTQDDCVIESCGVDNECEYTDRPAGDTTECGTCEECNIAGGDCTGINAETGKDCGSDCYDCVSGSCTAMTENDDGSCDDDCDSCVSGTCTDRTACDSTECSAGEYCDTTGGVCQGLEQDSYVCSSCFSYTWTGNGGNLNCCGNDANEDNPYEATEVSCSDGNDNDCDGLTDDNDPYCGETCECTSGVCCDGCKYRSSSYVCSDPYQTEYGCPWGTGCGDDVGKRTKKQYCPGNAATCTGTISDWSSWSVTDYCTSTETCSPGDSTCNYDSSCGSTSSCSAAGGFCVDYRTCRGICGGYYECEGWPSYDCDPDCCCFCYGELSLIDSIILFFKRLFGIV